MANMALAFDIMARDKGASKTFDRVGDSAKRAGDKGSTFGSMFKKGIGLASGALAAAGLAKGISQLGQFLGESIDEARESVKVGKTTAQIIKSTGGAAKVSAAQVGALAEKLSVKAGVDDEVIQTGANLLLTFKNVRNEAGKGAKVFDRATAAAVDLSAAGFGSVDSASKMLGKALNDPVKGISALSRAGVTFTAQQKKQIKTLTESGDVLGAQKIILGEVESQVGGVASASASMSDKVKVAWGNFKEQVGAQLLPVLDRLGAWFLEKGLPALKRFFGWVQNTAIPVIGRLGDWFKVNVLPKVQAFGNWLTEKLWPALKRGYDVIMPALRSALDEIRDSVGGGNTDWRKLGDTITQKVIPFIAKLVEVWLPAWAKQIRLVIGAVKGIWAVLETLLSIQRRVAKFIIDSFVKMTEFAITFLDALSNVPGFGWAKTAADKLRGAAAQGRALVNALNDIPRNVTVSVAYKSTYSGRFDAAPTGYGPGRAKGGPVRKGNVYPVGENPDGSWNSTTELFVPNQSGRIFNQKQLAAMAGAGSSSVVGGGGPVQLHPHTIAAIVDGIAARPNKISAGSFDAAMAARL